MFVSKEGTVSYGTRVTLNLGWFPLGRLDTVRFSLPPSPSELPAG